MNSLISMFAICALMVYGFCFMIGQKKLANKVASKTLKIAIRILKSLVKNIFSVLGNLFTKVSKSIK